MIRKLLTWWAANVVYRKHAYDEVCCCGSDMDNHSLYDSHTPRCQKEYAVTCWVDDIL